MLMRNKTSRMVHDPSSKHCQFYTYCRELVSSINDPGKKCGGIGLQHRGPLKSPTLPMNTIKLALIVQ